MNVLSLFDGISACHLALTRAGFEVDRYYTSEIDKYAEQVSMAHYPDAIRLGDVTKWEDWDIDWASIDLVTGGFPCQAWSVAGKQMGDKDPRGMLFWVMLDIMKTVLAHNPKAFFLMENVKMKKEFEQYITHHTEQALGEVNKHLINSALVSAQNRQRYYWNNIKGIEQPQDKGILLRDIIESGLDADISRSRANIIERNLGSKIENADLIGSSQKNAFIGKINGKCSTLSSAMGTGGGQIPMLVNRPREPRDFNNDSLCHHVADATDIKGLLVGESFVDRDKSYCIDANYHKGGNLEQYFEKSRRQLVFERPCKPREFNEDSICHHAADATDIKGNDSIKRVYAETGKATTLSTCQGGHREPKVLVGRMVGRKINPETGKRDDYNNELKAEQRIEPRLDEKSGTLTTVQKDNVLIVNEATKKGFVEIEPGQCVDLTFPSSKTRRGRKMEYKSNCLTAASFDYGHWNGATYRKLTPLECERLQTFDDNWTLVLDENGKQLVSNSQRYKALGNAWTVDVIAHIFSYLPRDHAESKLDTWISTIDFSEHRIIDLIKAAYEIGKSEAA